jgi:alkanesulfonate monooxygenase
VEEAYWFAEGVLPILEERDQWIRPDHARLEGASAVPFAPSPAS